MTDQKPEINLDVQILNKALACIDLAIKRGAYQPNEISTVGLTRDELEKVVNSFIENKDTNTENNKDS